MLKKFKQELIRIAPLLIVIALAIFIVKDYSQIMIQVYGLSMVAVSLIVFHYVRQFLFPYINLSDYAKKALESPVASAIVFAALIVLISVLIIVAKV